MELKYKIINDGKQKFNSIELYIYVPIFKPIDVLDYSHNNIHSEDETIEYTFYTKTLKEVEIIKKEFIMTLSAYLNKHQSLFKFIEGN